MIRKAIPHFFTLLNLLCGCIAVFLSFSNFFQAALLAVILGVFFDFFDGFFARLLKVESSLGVELDSLADMVTSGLVPGIILYQMFVMSGSRSIDYSFQFSEYSVGFSIVPLGIIGFLIPLGASLRLAKFNLIKEKLSYFKGLPTPANALFICALPLLAHHPLMHNIKAYILDPIFLIVIALISVFLMNINWKMLAFKSFKNANTFKIVFSIILILISILLFYLLGLAAFTVIIACYIIFSLLVYILGF